MVQLLGRIDSWLQKIFVVELPENIRRSVSKRELIDLFFSCEKDEEKFRENLVQLLEKRLPGKVTDKEISYCVRWVAAAAKK
jgi:ribosomal protein S4